MKRGQIALFVIIALAIMAIVLIFLIRPKLQQGGIDIVQDPQAFLSSCLNPEIDDALAPIVAQGGLTKPEGFLTYQDAKISYLCYTNENYKTCVVQEPLIKERVEEELARALKGKAGECVNSLVKEYESRGYSVSKGGIGIAISIIPDSIQISLSAPMTVSKENSRTYTSFVIKKQSQYYNILAIASSIVNFEATYGAVQINDYLRYYPDIKIEKTKLSEGSTIYKVSDVVTGESFTFASRSLVWPPGYTGT